MARLPNDQTEKIDLKRVNLEAFKPWINEKIVEYSGSEDDVLVEFVCTQLESPNQKQMQINLSGFLSARNARMFTEDLWGELQKAVLSDNGMSPAVLNLNRELDRKKQMLEFAKKAEREHNPKYVRLKQPTVTTVSGTTNTNSYTESKRYPYKYIVPTSSMKPNVSATDGATTEFGRNIFNKSPSLSSSSSSSYWRSRRARSFYFSSSSSSSFTSSFSFSSLSSSMSRSPSIHRSRSSKVKRKRRYRSSSRKHKSPRKHNRRCRDKDYSKKTESNLQKHLKNSAESICDHQKNSTHPNCYQIAFDTHHNTALLSSHICMPPALDHSNLHVEHSSQACSHSTRANCLQSGHFDHKTKDKKDLKVKHKKSKHSNAGGSDIVKNRVKKHKKSKSKHSHRSYKMEDGDGLKKVANKLKKYDEKRKKISMD